MNKRTHIVVAAAAGVIAEVVRCRCCDRPVELMNVILASSAAATFGIVPDILEPAVHPNHRSLFHGLAMAGCAGYGVKAAASQQEWPEWMKALAVGAAVGYLSHLALDATTPKSLPLLG